MTKAMTMYELNKERYDRWEQERSKSVANKKQGRNKRKRRRKK